MILTRTHALYFAARKLPKALREHAQDVTIDQCVNAHALRIPSNTAMHNALSILKIVRKHEGMGGVRRQVHEWANYSWPGFDEPGPDGRWPKLDRRYANARKWARHLAPADWDADPAVIRENQKLDKILEEVKRDYL